jgi:hypothetical protein
MAGDYLKQIYRDSKKGMEIIVDGRKYPLTGSICAEEVLAGGYIA